MQLFAVNEAGGVDDKMIVQLVIVAVGGYNYLMLRKKISDELHPDLVSLFGCELVLRAE